MYRVGFVENRIEKNMLEQSNLAKLQFLAVYIIKLKTIKKSNMWLPENN